MAMVKNQAHYTWTNYMLDEPVQNNDPFTQSSFSRVNQIRRLLWAFVYYLFFRISPRPFHAWRVFLLKCFGAKIGRGCHIRSSAKVWAPWNLVMKDYSSISDNVKCYSMAEIELGKKVVVSQGAHLCAGTHDYNSTNFQLVVKPIRIKSDSWVCADAFVGPGVVVEEGCVLGARSVTFKSTEAWSVYTGNPALKIRARNIHAE